MKLNSDEEKDFYNNSKEYKWKDLLYELFFEIKSEILGQKIEIEEDEYRDNLKKTSIPNLVKYIHDSIQILINKKIEEIKIKQKNDDNKYYLEINKNNKNIIPMLINEKNQYENIIRKLEEKERYLNKIIFQNNLQKDAMENKMGELMDMEEEFEEMKTKLKYDEGRFLENDRKDNEIIILRRENSNLKKEINKIEEKSKNFEKKTKDDLEIINGLKFKVAQLNKKVEEQKDEITTLKNQKTISTINENKDILNINKNIIEHYNKTLEKSHLEGINVNNITNLNGIGNNKINMHLKRDLTNYQLAFNNYNFESTKNNPVKALKTIDTNNKLNISTFNRIYNNSNNKNIIAPIRNNKFKNIKKAKSNSVAKKSEESEKSELINKYFSGNSNISNIQYDTSHSRIRSLNKINKNIQGIGNKLALPKGNINIRNIQSKDKHSYEHSALNILGINKII